MGVARWSAVILCVLGNIVDGLDLMLVSFALPHLPPAFASSTDKGLLVSAGFIGMGIGATLIAPLADRAGRKRLVVAGLVLSAVAMIATAMAPDMDVMLAARLFSGVAAGILTPSLLTLGDEFASTAKRGLTVGLVALGFPVGTALGGVVGLTIISSFGGDWRMLFWFGAVVSLAVLVLVAVALPESPAYLLVKGGAAAHERIARLAERMRLPDVNPVAEPPATEPSSPENNESDRVGVLSARYRARTLLLWLSYSLAGAAYYFISSWTPQLITTASGSDKFGAQIGTMVSTGALVGGLLFILAATRVLSTQLYWIAATVACLAQLLFAISLTSNLAVIAAVALGVTMQAALSAAVATCARLYPTAIRARAQGLLMGVSRVGNILVPILVGLVLSFTSARTLYLASGVAIFIAAATSFLLWSSTRHKMDEPRPAQHAKPRQLEALN